MTNTKLDALMADMQKAYPDQVFWAKDIPVGPPIPTGSLALDLATGYGGFPSDRVIELYGKEGTGKTTLALLTMANALRKYPKKLGLFLDTEHKMDKAWMATIVGDDIAERIWYLRPKTIEQACNMYRKTVETDNFCCAILDSIGGSPTVRSNEDAEVARVGGNAIGVGEFARSAATWGSTHNCLTIGINQLRKVIGSRIPNLTETPGGHAWRHACTIRIELTRGKDVDQIKMPGEEKAITAGYTIYGKVVKNQVGIEGRKAYWWFYNIPTEQHEFGVDRLDEIERLGVVTGVLRRAGGWYHHPALPEHKGEHKVQGFARVKELIRADDALRERLTAEILERLNDHINEVAPLGSDEPENGLMALYNSLEA